jgi:DNA-binding NtrC family response regulator
MTSRILCFIDETRPQSRPIDFVQLGTVVTQLSEVYQVVRERHIDILLIDQSRADVTAAVGTRLRRHNGLLELWELADSADADNPIASHFDGQLSRDLGTDGLKARLEEILEDKERLERYGLVGRSARLKAVARTIGRVATVDVSVLIVGPSGSGKELVARALHKDSPRSRQPFVAVNCGALAEGVLESELFGHEKGAFTGSVGRRDGLFHKAEGGTIFLDEIGETKPAFQIKLLRVLEDGAYYPVGSSSPLRANVRVIAATNRDLSEAIAERQFREDLYFRLGVVKIVVPSLRERSSDIQPLLRHFWTENPRLDYSDSALALLVRYDWPGNVRQLRNFATHMAAIKQSGLVDTADVQQFLDQQHASATHLPVATGRSPEEVGQELLYRAILSLGAEIRHLRNLITAHLPSEESGAGAFGAGASATTMEAMERLMIEKMLRDTGGNRKETARRLGIGERTLYRKLKQFHLG